MDFEKLGEEADKIQRKKLSHEETDSIFIAQTELLYFINMLRSNKIEKYDLESILDKLKEEFNEDRLVIDSETFDIFGNIEENNNKVKYIGSRSHREIEKSKFKIMNINKKIDVFDFTEKMQSIVNYLEGSIPKMNSLYDMCLYKLVPISKTIEENDFSIYNINVENELEESKEDDEGAYNLICLNYKEEMPLLYYTNSIFYDNTNKTLPIGMNLSSKVLVDNSKLDFALVNKTKFRTNSYFTNNDGNMNPKAKDIFVYEYDVYLKDEKNKIIDNLNSLEMMNQTDILDFEEPSEGSDYQEDEVNEESEEYSQAFYEDYDKFYNNVETEEMEQTENDNLDIVEEVTDEVIEDIIEETPQEPLIKKSRKLLKIEQQYEKEMEKQQKKEEKARKKLEKKNRKK
jgi:hypothetical protein